MNDSENTYNLRLLLIWLLAAMFMLFAGMVIYALTTIPLYQSQIVVIESEPRKSPQGISFIYPTHPSEMFSYLVNEEAIRQAVYQQLSLPNGAYSEALVSYNTEGLILSIRAKNPAMAQEIANETIHQINVRVSQERLNTYRTWEDKAAELERHLQLSYPPPDGPNGNQTKSSWPYQDLMRYQEMLHEAEPRRNRILEGEYHFYEVLEPATYSDTVAPYWKHLLLTWVYPSALER